MDSKENSRTFWCRKLFLICVIWAVLWMIFPIATFANDYIDFLENIVWGLHLQLGYDKHPPFCVYVSRLVYWLAGERVWALYLMSQVCIMTGIWAIWRLSNRFFSPEKAFLSTLILLFLPYFSSSSMEFNNNTVMLTLWALSGWLLYEAIKEQKIVFWLAVGLLSAFAMVTKYFTAVFLLGLFLAVVLTPEGRASFRKAGIYLAGLLFLAVIAPNMIWLYQHDFISLTYASEGARIPVGFAEQVSFRADHLFEYISRTLGAILLGIVPFLLLFTTRETWKNFKLDFHKFNLRYIFLICFVPFAFGLLFILLTGGKIKYSWMIPAWSFLGITLVLLCDKLTISNKRINWFIALLFVLGILNAISVLQKSIWRDPYLRRTPSYTALPGRELAEKITREWRNRYGTKLPYVVANRREACNVAVYSPDKPDAFFEANPAASPWIELADIQRKGGVIVWTGTSEQIPKKLTKQFKNLSAPASIILARALVLRILGEPKKDSYSYIFIQPATVSK